jgi:hypothetical protein
MQPNIVRRVFFDKETTREMLLNRFPKGGYGVEIGVFRGEFSEKILEITKPELLVLIDPWEVTEDDKRYYLAMAESRVWNKDAEKHVRDMNHLLYTKVREKFKDNPNIRIIREKAEDAVKLLEPNTFDFVYVDGDHFDVYNDIVNYYPLLKEGGYMCGDDYVVEWFNTSVIDDVDRFVKERKLKLQIISNQWIIRKQECN